MKYILLMEIEYRLLIVPNLTFALFIYIFAFIGEIIKKVSLAVVNSRWAKKNTLHPTIVLGINRLFTSVSLKTLIQAIKNI